jgi:hypothetical protein
MIHAKERGPAIPERCSRRRSSLGHRAGWESVRGPVSPQARLALALATLAVVVAVVVGLLAVRSYRAGGVEPPAQDRPGPVLIVPGYGGSLESLAVLATALRGQAAT